MSGKRFQPDELQDALFELQPPTIDDGHEAIEAMVKDPGVSIDKIAEEVQRQRRRNIAAREAANGIVPREVAATDDTAKKPERVKRPLKGGAFISGLKRRIGSTDSEQLREAVKSPSILELLKPQSIERQLQPEDSRQVYKNLLFTAKEYGGLTWEPRLISDRIDSRVKAKEDGRTPTEALERSRELRFNAAIRRVELIKENINNADTDLRSAQKLQPEIELPRYAHMTHAEMDELMDSMAVRYHRMVTAITQNHQLGTQRVEMLQAGLDYLLSQDDTRLAQYYWKDINQTFTWWTEQKLFRYALVETKATEELQQINDEQTVRSA